MGQNERPTRLEDRTVYTVMTVDRVNAAEQVAAEMGIPFGRIAAAGETYYPRGLRGKPARLGEGEAYMRVGTPTGEDLSAFWRKVDKVCPPPYAVRKTGSKA